ncbi:EPIDERMAL PATTERNING FACTOR-like protein 2 [Hibiscus syriacus]|uniref:Epidermal patterning factor-like protein n=1 Tax=Hibiscus syriacus TaxID=106335 RepID=A0A6A2ZNT1_HIBSY|nr:EPIDERMAL PATTERNING FACTOR-like protein 2 [Hibiscus syriacus]KAE8693380.1 EPIDERMAL PATTERNING FACTOR-like protein 2 [Hibiscus syriacus]
MVCSSHSFIFCLRPSYFSLLFLLILSTSQLTNKAQGRPNPESDSFSQTVNEEKARLRAQIGSRPPRCERRCNSCNRCEAIQVPTNPQARNGSNTSTLISVSNAAYARGDGNSNYKPMRWKCKCGNFIFNP